MHCSKLHPHSITSLAVESSVGGTIRPSTSAVLRLTGQAEVYDAVPCLWSNQYDLRPLTVGLSIGHDDIVVRGRPETRTFHCVSPLCRVIALDCVNATKDYVQGKSLYFWAAPFVRHYGV